MNDLVITERQNIVDIADAIRGKTGKADALTLEQMVAEIGGIEVGGGGKPLFEGSLTDEIANHIVSAFCFADIMETSLIEEIE